MSRPTQWMLPTLLLLALVVRVGWVMTRGVDEQALSALPDQVEYLEAGRNLLAGEGLYFTDDRFEQAIYASRTAAYPLFVALCGGQPRVIQLAQCLLDVSTVLAIYLLARRWLSERRSLFAAAVVAANPLMIYFCALILTESLYVAALAWSVYLVAVFRFAAFGVLLAALSVHIRPSAILLPMALGALAGWLHAKPQRRLLSGAVGALCGGVMLISVLAPWASRNHNVLGQWVWTTTNGGMTLYDGVHPRATGASDQSFVRELDELALMDELERDRYLKALSRQAIASDPARIANLAVIKTARTWSPIPLSDQFSGNPVYIAAGLLYTVPLFLLAAGGLIRSRLPWSGRLLLITPALVFTVMHAISVGSMRYRLPAEPMLGVLAAGLCLASRRQENLPTDPDA